MSSRKPTLADLVGNRLVIVDSPVPDDILTDELTHGIVWASIGSGEPSPLHIITEDRVPDWVERRPVSYPIRTGHELLTDEEMDAGGYVRPLVDPPSRSKLRALAAVVLTVLAMLVTAGAAEAHGLSHEVAFVVQPGTIAHLSSECVAQDQAAFSPRNGYPLSHRWNVDHDRVVFSSPLFDSGARVVFDGEAFHNHTHRNVVALVVCG